MYEVFWIIQNLCFWPYSFTMRIGNLSWGLPVKKALVGEHIADVSTTLVST